MRVGAQAMQIDNAVARTVRVLNAFVMAFDGTSLAAIPGMRQVEGPRWDDLALAILLLAIGIPRVITAAFYDRPLEAEGTLSIVCVVLGLAILLSRRR